jgi:hypothetical protein
MQSLCFGTGNDETDIQPHLSQKYRVCPTTNRWAVVLEGDAHVPPVYEPKVPLELEMNKLVHVALSLAKRPPVPTGANLEAVDEAMGTTWVQDMNGFFLSKRPLILANKLKFESKRDAARSKLLVAMEKERAQTDKENPVAGKRVTAGEEVAAAKLTAAHNDLAKCEAWVLKAGAFQRGELSPRARPGPPQAGPTPPDHAGPAGSFSPPAPGRRGHSHRPGIMLNSD